MWSPDGTRIAFQASRDGNAEIYVMNADGTGQTNLTNNPASESVPAWAPDGSEIVFHSSRDGNFEICAMQTDGSNPTRLTNDDDAVMDGAWLIQDRYRLPWWDALIVSSAQAADCTFLLSEDFQEGQDFGGVRVVHPFSVSPDRFAAESG
jgi:dipeptidyl aminopeptidase/acylaminoacyl peptidase